MTSLSERWVCQVCRAIIEPFHNHESGPCIAAKLTPLWMELEAGSYEHSLMTRSQAEDNKCQELFHRYKARLMKCKAMAKEYADGLSIEDAYFRASDVLNLLKGK